MREASSSWRGILAADSRHSPLRNEKARVLLAASSSYALSDRFAVAIVRRRFAPDDVRAGSAAPLRGTTRARSRSRERPGRNPASTMGVDRMQGRQTPSAAFISALTDTWQAWHAIGQGPASRLWRVYMQEALKPAVFSKCSSRVTATVRCDPARSRPWR